jgi:hypothetical protein
VFRIEALNCPDEDLAGQSSFWHGQLFVLDRETR